MKITPVVLITSTILLIAGCSSPTAPEAKDAEKYQGREETKSLQNADNIGYDGTGIQKKLDKALDQNDQRASDLNNQIEAQTDGETPEQQ